jgi:hypothetical protein
MLTSPFSEEKTDAPAAVAPEQAASPSTAPRRGLFERAEDRMPGLGSARLPSVAVVRAYHKAGNHIPFEAGLIEWPARVHGWLAVVWCLTFTCVAWAGAGAYRQRLRALWKVGIPGLLRAQLPPLGSLRLVPRLWVGFWSAIAWCGLKFWRFPFVLAYLIAVVTPFIF